MKTKKFLICALSAAASLATGRADAQNLSATLIDIVPGLDVEGTLDNGSYVGNYRTGLMVFTEFEAFCVEPTEDLSFPETLTYQVQDISLLANSDQIARLIGGYLGSAQTDQEAAAVQWAIWEITTESLANPSLLDGNVRISTPKDLATAELANLYLNNIQTYTPVALTYLTNDGRQDVVSWNVVPEPGSLGLAAFSALLILRRRR